jgi:uncharacterized SAM-dependent methyltransferase
MAMRIIQLGTAAFVAGRAFKFTKGETIHTGVSRKYNIRSFSHAAERRRVDNVWCDPDRRFAMFALDAADR